MAVLQKSYPQYIDAKGNIKIEFGGQNEDCSWLNMLGVLICLIKTDFFTQNR